MLTVVKVGIAVLSALIVMALLTPLLIFLVDIITNPTSVIQLRVERVKYNVLNQSVKVVLSLYYNGSIPLTNVSIEWPGGNIHFDEVRKGIYREVVTIPIESLTALQDLRSLNMSFSVGGLYPVTISIGKTG